VYPTYEAAIAAFEQATYESEQYGTAYVEELAENYGLIGELYMSVGQFERALEPLEKAVEYLSALDPEDLYIIDTSLYYCEALLRVDDPDYNSLGNELLVEIINILLPELNEYLNEYNYALQHQDEDWAWDLCFDLVDINEYLGWSYELLNDITKAGEYYHWASQYESRL
jgi:tetratricopeptide (TPR) repeat protein